MDPKYLNAVVPLISAFVSVFIFYMSLPKHGYSVLIIFNLTPDLIFFY